MPGFCSGPFIQLAFGAGTDRINSFEQAIVLAKKLNCAVEYKFNGTPISAYPDSTVEELQASWDQWQRLTKREQTTG